MDQDFESKVRERVEKEVAAKLEAAVKQAEAEGDGQTSAQAALARMKAIYRGEG